MKKNLTFLFFMAVSALGYSQSVTLLPNNENELVIKGNVDGITGTIMGKFSTRNNFRDLSIMTTSNHPVNFLVNNRTQARINPGGDFGVGNAVALSTWDGDISSANNQILSRLHSYGLGQKQFAGPAYNPFQTAMLGQGVGDAANFNRAGVLGITDGKAYNGYYNIGVASFATSDPAATSNTYNFWGYNHVTSNVAAYGIRNEVQTEGSGVNYGSYNSLSRSGTGNAYGTYNTLSRSNTGISYGTYNTATTTSTGNVYGTRNSATVTTGTAYGSFNLASAGTSTGDTYASYNQATLSGTSGTSHGTYNSVGGDRTLYGVRTVVNKTGTRIINVYGMHTKVDATTAYFSYGSYIEVNNPSGSYSTPYGLYSWVKNGSPNPGYGVYSRFDGLGLAGYFIGDVHVQGNLSKSSGTFKIDHPQDPENKYLVHSFVESPDMMNIYNGNITTDASGLATVEMPGYFNALNKDFRYQLTVIGTFAQAIVKEKLSGNTFVIETDKPNVEVSWMVTGIRQDAYANAHRIVPEVDKKGDERGKYLNPEVFGKTMAEGIHTSVKGKEGFEASNIDKVTQDQGHEPEEETIKQDRTPRTVVLPVVKSGADVKEGDN